jgi:hypothetical protein
MTYNSQVMFSQPMFSHQSTPDDDAYAGKSAETRHLKPGELSTGTTIMAVQFDGGVVLCAGAWYRERGVVGRTFGWIR